MTEASADHCVSMNHYAGTAAVAQRPCTGHRAARNRLAVAETEAVSLISPLPAICHRLETARQATLVPQLLPENPLFSAPPLPTLS